MYSIEEDSTPHAIHVNGANQAGSFSIPMKSPLSFKEQLVLMRERGLVIPDEDSALKRLAESNYYRLRGYWLTYENKDRFLPGTTFYTIWDTYCLDIELREWMWHAIAPIEIKARTLFAYCMAMECGPVAHKDSQFFKSHYAHSKSMESLTRETKRAQKSGVPCVVHNIEKYGDLPIWAAVEIMSMGTVSQLYGNLDPKKSNASKLIAQGFGVKPFLLRSWLRHLTYVRNICGHHSRLYNRIVTMQAKLIDADSPYDGNKEFPTILVLKRIYERSWPDRWAALVDGLSNIFSRYSEVSLRPMGFPENWHEVLMGTA